MHYLIAIVMLTPLFSWAHDLPYCRDESGGKNIFAYDFSVFPQDSDQSIPGNFGYANYVEALSFDRKDCQKELTVLVFMAASNDLSPYAFWDLTEMEASYSTSSRAG